jgi:alkyl sulfatase BDS1-like metallo-beta-lactamase superfamily hydrolase
MKFSRLFLFTGIAFILFGCDQPVDTAADPNGFTAPSATTIRLNTDVAKKLPLDDQQDFVEARKGLIARMDPLKVESPTLGTVWDQTAYGFMQGDPPASVNPSLWRQARLNNLHGLFEVAPGVYQLRGFDLANLTLIAGRTGWIVVDPLTAKETAATAFAFAVKHLGEKPIVAIIFTHSHIDHFGGVTGIISPEAAAKQQVRVIAPEGFMEEAVSENIIAGTAMSRRALYMYGRRLPRSERGHVGSGLGKEPALGTMGILEPTEIVSRTGEEKIIDGVRFVFQNVPGSEAPAELTFYLPELKVFCGAEIVSRTLHNLYTLRGTKVRDALKWSYYIDEAIQLFGEAEIYFGGHHWPIWGNQRIIAFLKQQRDIYKYIHDQTLRLANAGLTPREISAQLDYPESLKTVFANRGYYGTLSHNVKAVYQYYFGWYDGNPAHLDPLTPVESAIRYVEYMGGAAAILKKAQTSFDQGEYRWVAEVLHHLVFAEPDNVKAKDLLARTYDQLGYQAESGPWRDNYLTAAYELRHGGPQKGLDIANTLEMLRHTPIPRFLDAMAARLKGPEADGLQLTINLIFTDLGESYRLQIENAVLHHRSAPPDPQANATVEITRELYLQMAIGQVGIKDLMLADDLKLSGSKIDLIRFFALFDQPEGKFNIVTP